MNDSAQVNQVYLIFNRPQFLVDSSDRKSEIRIVLTPPTGIYNIIISLSISHSLRILFSVYCLRVYTLTYSEHFHVLHKTP